MSDLGTAVAAAPGHRSGPAEIARDLVLASRPLSWINTALPFLAASFAALQGLDAAVLLGFAYFLVPYNLLMYGVNDIFDYESDLRNPRKRSAEGGLVPPDRRRITWLAIAVTSSMGLTATPWPYAAVSQSTCGDAETSWLILPETSPGRSIPVFWFRPNFLR